MKIKNNNFSLIRHVISGVILLLITISCESYFLPNVNEVKPVLVFEGLITDKYDEHYVKITLAGGYTDSIKENDVKRYNVYIESDKGDIYPLTEYYRGFYKTENTVKGEVGVSYRFVAESRDGEDIYRSDFEKLTSSAPIDTITAVEAPKKILVYNEIAGFDEELIDGMDLRVTLSSGLHSPFYRCEFNVIFESRQRYPTEGSYTTVYLARPEKTFGTDYVSVINSFDYSNKEVLNKVFAFIPEYELDKWFEIVGLDYGEETGRPIVYSGNKTHIRDGFLLKLSLYSLSEIGYKFWEGIYNQQNASGQIFDPVNAQIEGNVKNISNPEELVLGYFGTSAVQEYPIHIDLNSGRFYAKPIKYFPEITGLTIYNETPDFWIYGN